MAAKNDWITNGYKEEYDQIAAFIAQVEGRSMLTLKQQYIDDMEKARLTGLSSVPIFTILHCSPAVLRKAIAGGPNSPSGAPIISPTISSTPKKAAAAATFPGFFNVGGKGSYERPKVREK